MPVTLDSREIAQLQTALETILTPIAHTTPKEWGCAVMRDVNTLLRADQVFFALPLDASVHVTGHGERTAEAGREYEHDCWQTDFVIGQRRKALGLEWFYLAEPEAERLQSAVRRVGHAVARIGHAKQEPADEALNAPSFMRLHTTTNTYEIRGTRFAAVAALPGATGMVMVDAVCADHIRRRTAAARVRKHFRLTRQETEVALLLARRFTVEEIATTLGISYHTVKHHTENIFSKTAVSSRSMIADLVDR